jgi:hypothetical protein
MRRQHALRSMRYQCLWAQIYRELEGYHFVVLASKQEEAE